MIIYNVTHASQTPVDLIRKYILFVKLAKN